MVRLKRKSVVLENWSVNKSKNELHKKMNGMVSKQTVSLKAISISMSPVAAYGRIQVHT